MTPTPDDEPARTPAHEIKVLKGLEAVRRRPAMYVGDCDDGSGQHRMLWLLLGEAIAEHLHGTATSVQVRIDGDSISIEDDGRGLPVDPIPRKGSRPGVEVIFSLLFCGSGRRAPGYSIGPAVANALSSRLAVDVWRDGRAYRQRFAAGETVGPLLERGVATRTGTRITFTPDRTILRPRPWDVDAIATRLRAVAALAPGLTTRLGDETFRAPDGLADHVRWLARDHVAHHAAPVRLRGTVDDNDVEVGLLWTDRPRTRTRGFLNWEPAPRGVHLAGLHLGIRDAVTRVAPDRLRDVNLAALREVVAEGLIAAVHVTEPSMGWSAKDDPAVRDAVRTVVGEQLATCLERDPALRAAVLGRLPG